jgi:hypothetical protein
METHNLIIIILSVLLVLLIIWNYNTSEVVSEEFTTDYDNNENILGNILDFAKPENVSYTKLFKKTYSITGFYVRGPESYTFKVNGSFVSNNEAIELESNKYYDITDLNVKTKSVEIFSKNKNIDNVIIYGLNTYNTKNNSIYNKSVLLVENTINDKLGSIEFKGGADCLVDYLKLPALTEEDITDSAKEANISIGYKNKFNISTFQTYKSGIANFDNKFHVKSSKIYFDTPLLATELKFNINPTVLNDIKVYGKVATDNDINTFRLESDIANSDDSLVVEEGKCPPMKDIITKQKLINDLCNSMSEKDKIRNQQTYYEKTKKYISKLKQQNNQIQALKSQIAMLKAENNNTSLSVQEKIDSAQSMLNELNINSANPFNKIAINYTDEDIVGTTNSATATTNSATTTTNSATTTTNSATTTTNSATTTTNLQ